MYMCALFERGMEILRAYGRWNNNNHDTQLYAQKVGYRQVSNISRTNSQHLRDSRTVLWLSLANPLKPDVKSRMKM